MKYIIGTGWWCDGTGKHKGTVSGSDFIRSKEFFNVWYYFVNKYTSPEKIIIVDSASPIRPSIPDDKRIEFISTDQNYQHAKLNKTQFDGWTRSFLLSAYYALMCEADYFIYIEQDCLVIGEHWVEQVIDFMQKNKNTCALGKWEDKYEIDQSLTVIEKSYIFEAIKKLHEPTRSDFEKRAEFRFRILDYDFLPFGYNRNRPINFNDKTFYAQQWTEDELRELFTRENCEDLWL